MKIKRFFAKDMRTALADVKESLGADAVIMSNKKVTGGVEIVAAIDYQSPEPKADDKSLGYQNSSEDSVNISSISRQMIKGTRQPTKESNEQYADSLATLLARQQKLNISMESNSSPTQEIAAPKTLAEQERWSDSIKSKGRATAPPLAQANQPRDKEIKELHREMATIRKLLEHQLSGLMWQEVERREPMRALLIQELKKLGFDEPFADHLAGMIPENITINQGMVQLAEILTSQLKINEDDILRHGGAVALLGPTGVGKTTTIAKLAARFAMKFGADQVALITTDNYRIGAHEQLHTYGRIMGSPVRQVRDADELATVLFQFRNRRLVLIDTAGMGQRDVRLSEQLDTLVKNTKVRIRSYLVISATSQRRVMQEAVEHFRQIPLSGCILTKLDESLNLGEVINVCIQNSLPISYITDGQRVPEDIKIANAAQLIATAIGLLERETVAPYFWGASFGQANDSDTYE